MELFSFKLFNCKTAVGVTTDENYGAKAKFAKSARIRPANQKTGP